uniref:hypothetical protein n=1 Tax=uncultured Erythrobacter sp. TaxID=263913 RepID=UPI002637EBB2|nr:hypothetical protein [uncultured Erythrobacter sp.]
MSQQLALSSLFSVLALAVLSLASVNGMVGVDGSGAAPIQPFAIQAELAPGLNK